MARTLNVPVMSKSSAFSERVIGWRRKPPICSGIPISLNALARFRRHARGPVLVREGRYYRSATITAGIDLPLALVEESFVARKAHIPIAVMREPAGRLAPLSEERAGFGSAALVFKKNWARRTGVPSLPDRPLSLLIAPGAQPRLCAAVAL